MTDRTHYDVIDAEPRAAKADLKAAYVSALEAAQASGDADEVLAVRRAWQVLSDPVQRQRYDDEIGLTARGASTRADEAVDVEVVDDDEADEDSTDLDDDVASLSPKEMRQRLFHHVPEFLEQPTLGRRLTASLIDVITTVAVLAASGSVAYAAIGDSSTMFWVLGVLFEIWVIGLFIIPTYRTGQTLGKRFTFVMCVDRETGNLPTFGQVIRRYIVPMVAGGALGVAGMGGFLALFFGLSYAMGRDQLSLADRLARTVVVIARYRPTRDGAPA